MKQSYTKETVKKMHPSPKPEDFVFFWGHKPTKKISCTCLSQWYAAKFEIDGVTYSCAEQYMMSQKARVCNDSEALKEILATEDPKKQKALGRKIKNFDTYKWGAAKFKAVVKGNLAKFSQNEDLKEFLLSTGDAVLVEASPNDKIWGIGMRRGEAALNVDNWKGQNLLGFALMQVRDALREQNN